jgi:fructosamine-3-kinase
VKAPAFLEPALRRALADPDLRLVALHPASGGCIHHAARVATTAGHVFVKWNEDAPADLFPSEADGLRALRASGSELVIPRPLGASAPTGGDPGFIAMECLEPGGSADLDEALGRGLAHVHRRSAGTFGFAVDTYCGPTRQDNARGGSWVDFYRERRLDPLVRRVEERRGMESGERAVYERVLDRLPERLGHDPAPSLIHGDLWSGNVMGTPRGPSLFDPACTFADREMEFGITTLFGGFPSRFWRAYEEAWPLSPGWRDRNPLYQLYHLLNHHLIFGGHYGAEALAVARRLV